MSHTIVSPAMDAHRPPNLPSAWPYPAREPLPSWVRQEGVDLGPFGPGWTVWGPEDGALAGTPEPLGGAFGRGGIARVGDRVVRPYRRGGLVRFVNASRYASPRRFQREAEIHRFLWESGFPTVEPLGCAWRRRGLGVEGLYLTRFRQAQPWPRSFEAQAWPEIKQLLQALVSIGCWVPDLNATNLLIEDGGRVLALDFDRAAFVGGDLWPRYLRRLSRSLEKLQAPEPLRILLEARP